MSGLKPIGDRLKPGHGEAALIKGAKRSDLYRSVHWVVLYRFNRDRYAMAMARRAGEWLRSTRMCKRFEGTGVAKIQCSEGAFSALRLDNIPTPSEWGEVVDGRRYVYADTRQMGADSVRYRVIWPELSNGEGSRLKTGSFTLADAHCNETLFVLAEFLRDQGVDFVRIANKHGNGFRDSRLSGTKLAYLTRTIPHSPACHVDFVSDDAPELGGTPGRVGADAPLNGDSD